MLVMLLKVCITRLGAAWRILFIICNNTSIQVGLLGRMTSYTIGHATVALGVFQL